MCRVSAIPTCPTRVHPAGCSWPRGGGGASSRQCVGGGGEEEEPPRHRLQEGAALQSAGGSASCIRGQRVEHAVTRWVLFLCVLGAVSRLLPPSITDEDQRCCTDLPARYGFQSLIITANCLNLGSFLRGQIGLKNSKCTQRDSQRKHKDSQMLRERFTNTFDLQMHGER